MLLCYKRTNRARSIGGGGYVPARILRSFLKKPGERNIPIQAIGLSLYESLETDEPEELPGTKVTRTQWLDFTSLSRTDLLGKNILIVDEVDDTRTTLQYAVSELEKDVREQAIRAGKPELMEQTKFSIFVLHNKDKEKKGVLPESMLREGRYLAAQTVGDEWICYPWEAMCVFIPCPPVRGIYADSYFRDIDEHDALAKAAGNQ